MHRVHTRNLPKRGCPGGVRRRFAAESCAGSRVAFRFAACARESSGESCAQTLNRAFPEACNVAKRSGRLSGIQRKKLPRSGAEPTLAEVSQAGEGVQGWA